jgi:NADH:ubiquinone oxidoreductase subunit K
MLLSGSVMLVNVAAGIAAIGVGLMFLNYRFYGRQ